MKKLLLCGLVAGVVGWRLEFSTLLWSCIGIFGALFLWARYEALHPQDEMPPRLYVPRDGEWPAALEEDVSYVRHGGLDP